MLHEDAAKSSQVERLSGYAKNVIQRYPISDKDCFLVVSTSGINPFPMEMAEGAKACGAKRASTRACSAAATAPARMSTTQRFCAPTCPASVICNP